MGVLFPEFSEDVSLLEGNTPILINRGLLIRGQHYEGTLVLVGPKIGPLPL